MTRSGRSRVARALLAALLALAGTAACTRPVADTDDARVELTVRPQPPAVGIAEVEILLADARGRPLPAVAVELEGNMTHPGMRPTTASARAAGPGRWLADLDLTMGGDWVVSVEARLEDGRTVRRDVPLHGVAR